MDEMKQICQKIFSEIKGKVKSTHSLDLLVSLLKVSVVSSRNQRNGVNC